MHRPSVFCIFSPKKISVSSKTHIYPPLNHPSCIKGLSFQPPLHILDQFMVNRSLWDSWRCRGADCRPEFRDRSPEFRKVATLSQVHLTRQSTFSNLVMPWSYHASCWQRYSLSSPLHHHWKGLMDVESPEKIGGSRIYVELFIRDIPWLIWVVVSSLKRHLDFRFVEKIIPCPLLCWPIVVSEMQLIGGFWSSTDHQPAFKCIHTCDAATRFASIQYSTHPVLSVGNLSKKASAHCSHHHRIAIQKIILSVHRSSQRSPNNLFEAAPWCSWSSCDWSDLCIL